MCLRGAPPPRHLRRRRSAGILRALFMFVFMLGAACVALCPLGIRNGDHLDLIIILKFGRKRSRMTIARR
jgi:hypothetical protein